MRQRPSSEQHDIGIALVIQQPDQHGNKRVHRESAQALLSPNRKHLTELRQRLHLLAFLTIGPQARQNLLQPPTLV